jgi:CheY-like chemotaxis protein
MENKKRILVVDDNSTLAIGAKILLKQTDFEPIIAYDGLDGLEKARKEKPDLILLDISMPLMNGDEVYSRLHCDPDTSKIPIIVMTGLSKEEYESCDFGASKIIPKPVTSQILLEAIENELSLNGLGDRLL